MGGNSSKSKTSSRAKLPAKSLADALEVAKALRDFAASGSKAVIADQMSTTLSSSQFKQKFASAGYYGLIEKDGDKFKLSSRGDAALDGDEVAKRTAVMATGFGPIIASLATRQVAPNIIESRLKNDHGATDSGAKTSAAVLVSSAKDAGLINNDKFDARAIESVDSKDIAQSSGSGSESDSTKETSSAQKKTAVVKSPKSGRLDPDPPSDPATRKQLPIQVVVQVDGSKMDPDKIADLVKLLRDQS
jgi:hypothetical protein